uniref:Nibrin n=1 Tax=Terrapene triunguis TaxID=2587831 RepID=A0A674IM51_9SAUR
FILYILPNKTLQIYIHFQSQALSVPELIIQDTSKYGTFVNGEKVLNGTSRTLKSGDRVNFGVFESKFRVEYEPLIVCSSCLEVSGKTALNQAILQLGGLVVNDWSEECTHLVMISVKVTVKTICALICNRPIIKPEYFVECIRAIQSKQQLPKLESFYPPVDEPAIGPEKLDLSMRHERKIIFRGKTFLFLSAKQVTGLWVAKIHRKNANFLIVPYVQLAAKQPVSPGSAILHPTLSQSLTVDETIMPVTTSDRAYVADTEPEEPCGEETEKTPKMDRRDKMYSQNITSVKETPSTSGSVNTGTVLPRMHRTLVVDQKSQPLSPSKILGVNRNRERASQQESNSIKHYFQAAPKKRERIEEGETSVPKLAKMEEKSSPLSSQTQPTTSLMWKSKVEQTQKEQYTLDLKTNLSPVDTSLKLAIESSKSEKDKTVTKNVSSEKPASKKRKELSDLVEDAATLELVFGSKELDWEAEMGDCGEEHGTNMQKKRRLETKGKRIEEENVIQEEANRILFTEQIEVLLSPFSSHKNTDGLQDVSSNLPSRLLLTEFRSLVVSHPRPNSLVAAQINYKQLNNFKKFKKVPYPGAGQLPHIIGGSDLIGHHAKKNSQLEEWLRQEMEVRNSFQATKQLQSFPRTGQLCTKS